MRFADLLSNFFKQVSWNKIWEKSNLVSLNIIEHFPIIF